MTRIKTDKIGIRVGAISRMILRQPRGAFFTPDTFTLVITKKQARECLRWLFERGKLVRHRKGSRGRYGLGPVYEVAA